METDKEISQQGGKYLSEGADGCIFQSPDNWPCLKSLKGYSPKDKSLVTKIVPSDDIEGDILEAIKAVAKNNSARYNLVKYIGQCSPKLSGFNKTQKKSYNNHIKQIKNTEKACKSLASTLKNDQKSNGKNDQKKKTKQYKMYVIGKYEMTFKEYVKLISESKLSKDTIADILYDAHVPFLETLEALLTNKTYTIVNYDLHSKNIAVFKNPNKVFNFKDEKTFQIGPADFGRAVWQKNSGAYSLNKFKKWDQPYLDAFLTTEELDEIGDTFARYNQYSFEARILNFIMCYKNNSSKKLWIEQMSVNKYVKARVKKETTFDIFLAYLPTFIESVKKSDKYKKYEEKLEGLVRLLSSDIGKSEDRFEVLKRSPKMREFLDGVKKRSHIPTAFGVFVMHSLRACRYTKDQIMELVANPAQTKIDIPDKLRLLIIKYTDLLLEPFN